MELATLIAILGSAIAIIAAMFSLFLWVRSEANSDRRLFQDLQREDRKDLLQISRNLETTMNAIQQEMKDFHTKLYSLEERNRTPHTSAKV